MPSQVERIYCLCGGSMKFTVTGQPDVPAQLRALFWDVHDGEGHGEATQAQAAAARKKVLRESG